MVVVNCWWDICLLHVCPCHFPLCRFGSILVSSFCLVFFLLLRKLLIFLVSQKCNDQTLVIIQGCFFFFCCQKDVTFSFTFQKILILRPWTYANVSVEFKKLTGGYSQADFERFPSHFLGKKKIVLKLSPCCGWTNINDFT